MVAVTSFAGFPVAPVEKGGWPWKRESPIEYLDSSTDWPRISIVTPSYNQAAFIEETIRSILLQGYPNLEYIVIDGGSTDGSVEIIKKYEPWLTYWVSEADRGMYDAINKGFSRATGDIMAWSNTDDIYLPGAFRTIAEVFRQFREVEWLTSLWKVQWDESGNEINRYRVKGFSRKAFFQGYNLPGLGKQGSFTIQQQSTFWRRSLWDRAGGRVDDSLALAGDYELWARFYRCAELFAVDEPLGVFRFQPAQKTAKQAKEYLREAEDAFYANGGCLPSAAKEWFTRKILRRLPSSLLLPFTVAAWRGHIIERDEKLEWNVRELVIV